MRLPHVSVLVRDALALWGAFSLAVAIAVAGLLAYAFVSGGHPRTGFADADDVRFVLAWSGLDEARTEAVLESYRAKHPLLADHLEAYAIRVSSLQESQLDGSMLSDHPARERWTRGDLVDAVTSEAIDVVTRQHEELPWFPTAAELNSARFFVYRQQIVLRSRVAAATLIFARPSDRTLFYISYRS